MLYSARHREEPMPYQPISLPITGHVELHLLTRSGRVTLVAEERPDVLVEEGVRHPERIESDPTGRIKIASSRKGSADLLVRCPRGTDAVIGTMSGNVTVQGHGGALRITTVTGNVAV